jgi:uncharacterized membrane protein YgcG
MSATTLGGTVATPSDMDAKGLVRSLYDFSFTSLITTKIIRFVYALIVILLSIGAVILLLGSLATGRGAAIIFGIIFVPLGYLVYLILTRIWMEVLIVVFRIGEDIRAIRISGGGLGSAGGSGSGPAPGGGSTWGGDQPPAPSGPPS